jgi:hypothetical protein
MKTELIDLGHEADLGGELAWKRSKPPAPKPVNEAPISPQERLLREYWESMRSHEYSPLND